MTESHKEKLLAQIAQVNGGTKYLKHLAPDLFPEWKELLDAKADALRANERCKAALKAWEDLGASWVANKG